MPRIISIIDPSEEREVFRAHGVTREGILAEVPEAELYANANLPSTPERADARREALEFDLIRYVMEGTE